MTEQYVPIVCPCGCGHVVTLTMGGFETTTVEVEACPTRREGGIRSVTYRKSVALDFHHA